MSDISLAVTRVFCVQEARKKEKDEKREPLDESQEFIVNLAKDLSRVCQVEE